MARDVKYLFIPAVLPALFQIRFQHFHEAVILSAIVTSGKSDRILMSSGIIYKAFIVKTAQPDGTLIILPPFKKTSVIADIIIECEMF